MNRLCLQFACVSIVSIAFSSVEVFTSSVAVAGIVPDGSRIWLTISAPNNIEPPDVNGNQFVATASGPNAPVIIPLDTWSDPNGSQFGYLTSGVEVTSGTMADASLYTNKGDDVFIALNDTYTVHGSVAGSFAITATLHVIGTYGTIPNASLGNFLANEVSHLEIGTFHPEAVTDQFVVNPFPGDDLNPTTTEVVQHGGPVAGAPQTFPLDVQVSYTKMVSVDDVFDIAYGIDLAIIGSGQMDVPHAADITFTLPTGVYLTSALGETFGVSLPGDGNGDGWVDGLDYLLWAGAYGTHPGPDGDISDGDYNDDGWVDGLDYLLWAGAYGTHAAAAVPEPSSAFMALAATLLLLRRRSERKGECPLGV